MFFFSPWRVLTGRYIEWTRNVYCKVAAELYNILRMIKCLRLKYIPQPWPLCYVSHCSLIINRCKINEGNFHWDDDVGSSRSEVSIPETVIPRIWCFKKEIAVNTVETAFVWYVLLAKFYIANPEQKCVAYLILYVSTCRGAQAEFQTLKRKWFTILTF